MSDFATVIEQTEPTPTATDDFAGVNPSSATSVPTKPTPLKTSIMALAAAPDTPQDSILALQAENIAATKARLEQGAEYSERLRIAGERQKRTALRLNEMRKAQPGQVISQETSQFVDEAYRVNAERRIEDDAASAAEDEAIRRIQDHLTAGETVEAQLSYDLITKGNANKRWSDYAAKNLILGQAAERFQAEAADESWLGWGYNLLTSIIPTSYNFSRSGVVPGSKTSLKNFFLSGSNLASQSEDLWNKYTPSELAEALKPGGDLDVSIRSNATTLGGFDPSSAAAITGGLKFQSYSDRMVANAWGIADPLLATLPGVGVVPWKTFGSIPGALTRIGSRSGARRVIGDAFETVVREGEEAAIAKHGLSEANVADELTPTAINPGASTEHAVPHGVDVDTHLKAAEKALADLPTNLQVSRATTPEEITHAYEAAVKAEEKRLGKSIKDFRFMHEDVRTGERFEFKPGQLPEQGNIVSYVEYTVGKKSGGGFATRRAAVAESTKRGLTGAEIEGSEIVGEKLVRNAEAGFTQRVYHGTGRSFDDYDPAMRGSTTGADVAREATFFTSNPDMASSYARVAADTANHKEIEALRAKLADGSITDDEIDTLDGLLESVTESGGANVRIADLNTTNFADYDMAGDVLTGPSKIAAAKAEGRDGVILRNYADDGRGGTVGDVYAVFNMDALRSGTSTIQRDVSGQYFIKNRVNVKEDGFFTTPLNTPDNNFMSGLRSDARRMDRSAQMKAVAAGQNAEKLGVAVQHEMKNALKGLGKAEKQTLDEIIRKGQNMSKWLSDREFNAIYERAAGDVPREAVVDAYKKYRLLNDMEYIIRNDELYKAEVIGGRETVGFEAGPIRFDGTATVTAEGAVPTERVFNTTDGIHYTKNRPLTSDEYARLKGEGYLMVTTKDIVTMPDGTVVRNFLVKRGEIERKPLERMQLNYSEGGHRAYTGRYFAKQATGGVQPDTGQVFLKNPNVFRTGNNPNRLNDWARVMNEAIERAKEGNLDAQWYDDNLFANHPGLSFPSGREFVEAVDRKAIDLDHRIEIVGDREMPSAYISKDYSSFVDETETGATGYYRTTGRLYTSRKGEHLLDESGEFAETVDPWETLNTAMYNVSRMSSLSNYKTNVLERFEKTYGKFVKDSGSQSDLIKSDLIPGLQPELARRIKAEQAGIKRILGFETEWEKGVKGAHSELARWVLGDALGGYKETAHDFVYWLRDHNPVQALRSIAFDAKLGMFNVGQLFLQSSTMAASIALSPRHGLKSMMTSLPLLSHTLMKGDGAVLDVLAKRSWKAAGFGSEAEYKEFFQFVDKTGFMQVGNTHLLINDHGPNRVFGAASMVDGIREKGRSLFYMAEQLNRSVASRIAYETLVEQGVAKGTAEFRERFIGIADDLTLNMTAESGAAFQHGLMSIPTQFWAYNVRMMDAMIGNQFTKAQKARLIFSQFALFGAGGVPAVDYLFDYAKRNTHTENFDINTILGTIDRGMMDKAINAISGADVRFGERVGTGAFSTDLVKDIFGMGEYGEKSPAETFGGATFSISTQIAGTLKDAVGYAFAETGADQGRALTKDSVLKLAMNISSMSNVIKAIEVYNYGMYRSASGAVQASDLPSVNAFGVAIGLRPQELEDLGLMNSYKDNKKEIVKEAATQMRNWRQEAFSNPDKYEENREKANTFMMMLPAEIRTQVLKQTNAITEKSFYEKVAADYHKEINSEVEETNDGE